MDNYEELARNNDWESLQRLILAYADETDISEQRRISKAFYLVSNRKLLIASFFEALKSVDDSQKRFIVLKLALRISRPAFIYEYLTCSYRLGVRPKGTGLFEKNIKPFSDYEKKEVVRHIIDNSDYRVRIIHLAGVENLSSIQNGALACVEHGEINKDIMKCLGKDLRYAGKCQNIIKNLIYSDPDTYGYMGRYLDVNKEEVQTLIASLKLSSMVWDSISNNIWLNDSTRIVVPILNTMLKIDRYEYLSDVEKADIKNRINEDLYLLGDIDSASGSRYFMFLRKIDLIESGYQEKVLIRIYEKTKIYSNRALQELAFIGSEYAYRQMLYTIVSTSNSSVRIRYALRIAKTYKEHIPTLCSCARSLQDAELLRVLEEHGIITGHAHEDNKSQLVFTDVKQVSVIDNSIIVSELMISIAERIKASVFYCAVGFAYRSGLRMILPIIDAVTARDGDVDLIIGSLQDYCIGTKNTRMDRNSAEYLQMLLTKNKTNIYGYPDTFYHGKFYYISNGDNAYVLLGSSNISKTAYLSNYELDLLLEFECNSMADKSILAWYDSFKVSCLKIDSIDLDRFDEFTWTGTQDTTFRVSAKKEAIGSVRERISKLTDDETKYRLNLWLQYGPGDIYSHLNIDSLYNYMVFLYPERELAVFESFEPGNAYYTFRYTDFEELLCQVSGISKTQMLIASNFLGRGYHIQEKDRLEEKIKKYFAN